MFEKLIGILFKKTKKTKEVTQSGNPIEIKKIFDEFISPENLEKEIGEEIPKMDAKPKRKPRKKKDDN